MKKNILIFMMFLFLNLFIITGCSSGTEKDKKQAKINAINYIQDKYGFTPQYVNARCITMDGNPFVSKCTGIYYVEFDYNKKNFYVRITGTTESTDGIDNYQQDEIINDILYIIEQKLGFKPYQYNFSFSNNNRLLLEEYYTRDKLETLLSKEYVNISLEYVNEKNFDTSINDEKLSLFKNITLLNYYSEDSLKFANSHTSLDEYKIKKNAIYLKSVFFKEFNKSKKYTFNLFNYDNMYFMGENNEKIAVSNSVIDDMKNWDGRGAKNAKQISNSYSLETNADYIYIYIPYEDYKKYNSEMLSIAVQCNQGDEKKYVAHGPLSHIGKYYVESFPTKNCSNIKFTIIESHH